MRLWMRQRVVASDRKLLCLASTVTRHEYMRMVVSGNFEHVTHLIGDSLAALGFRTGKVDCAFTDAKRADLNLAAKPFAKAGKSSIAE